MACSTRGSARTSSGRKLKRRKTTGQPPIVQERLCVGAHAVPIEITEISGQARMVADISASKKCAPWLMHALGWSVFPTVCIIKELKDAVMGMRRGRCSALWKGKDGQELISTTVRDREVLLLNNRRHLRLVVDVVPDPDSGEKKYPSLEWFIEQLYQDLQDADSDSEASSDSDAEGSAGSVDDALQARIQKLTAPDGDIRWAKSRNAFLVKAVPGAGKDYLEWSISRKCLRDPSAFVKRLVATRKAIAHFQETGEITKVTDDDLGNTDDEL